MGNLSSKAISSTYKDVLNVNSLVDNQGMESSLKTINDGEGIASALSISTTDIGVRGSFLTDSVTAFVFKVTAGSTGDVYKLDVGNDTIFSVTESGTLKLNNQSSTPTPITGGVYYKDGILYGTAEE